MSNFFSDYVSPKCYCYTAFWEELLCSSPDVGGLEDVGFEDWVVSECDINSELI